MTMFRKNCLVPICNNNSLKAPHKYYIRVPVNKETRKKWYEAMNIENSSLTSTKLYVCEDHFSLEKDAVNWMYFKTIGKILQLKKDVVPHKNIHSIEEHNPSVSQFTPSDKRRKLMHLEEYRKSKEIEFVEVDSIKTDLPIEETVFPCGVVEDNQYQLRLINVSTLVLNNIFTNSSLPNSEASGSVQNLYLEHNYNVKVETHEQGSEPNAFLECNLKVEPQEPHEENIENSLSFCKVEYEYD